MAIPRVVFNLYQELALIPGKYKRHFHFRSLQGQHAELQVRGLNYDLVLVVHRIITIDTTYHATYRAGCIKRSLKLSKPQ